MSAHAILDADGHVTESQEQVSKYLDDRHKRRPQTFSFYPWDGWDRRLLGTLGDAAGNAESWLRALDKGGMESPCLYPHARPLHECSQGPGVGGGAVQGVQPTCSTRSRLEEPTAHGSALLARAGARRVRRGAAPRGEGLGPLRRHARRRRHPPPRRSRLRPVYTEAERRRTAGNPRLRLASGRSRPRSLPALHPGAYCSHAFGRCASSPP